jgi:hypothetical protein
MLFDNILNIVDKIAKQHNIREIQLSDASHILIISSKKESMQRIQFDLIYMYLHSKGRLFSLYMDNNRGFEPIHKDGIVYKTINKILIEAVEKFKKDYPNIELYDTGMYLQTLTKKIKKNVYNAKQLQSEIDGKYDEYKYNFQLFENDIRTYLATKINEYPNIMEEIREEDKYFFQKHGIFEYLQQIISYKKQI